MGWNPLFGSSVAWKVTQEF